MSFVLSFVRRFTSYFRMGNAECGGLRYQLQPLRGLFYVEYVSKEGDVREQRIEAKHLVEKNGRFYLYGWCEKMPCFHSVPVERITILADHDTGEVIPREDVILWLKKRILH